MAKKPDRKKTVEENTDKARKTKIPKEKIEKAINESLREEFGNEDYQAWVRGESIDCAEDESE